MVGYRTHAEPSIIRRSAELWPEGAEDMGLATSFVPPFPFPGMPGLTSSTVTSSDAVPDEHNLSFVRGDAFSATFLFVGECWTPEPPVPGPSITWEQRYWASEIRDLTAAPGDPCLACGCGWIPIWGGLPANEYKKAWFTNTKTAEFACEAVYSESPLGTLVTISLTSAETIIFPGDHYHWDLQSAETRTVEPETGAILLGGVRTWMQGIVTVHADYTITPEKV